jgi:hypothetical protein
MTDVALRPRLGWRAQTEAMTDNALRPGSDRGGPPWYQGTQPRTTPDPASDTQPQTPGEQGTYHSMRVGPP